MTPPDEKAERRAHTRKRVSTSVLFRDAKATSYRGWLRDIARGGCFIASPSQLAIGDTLDFDLRLPGVYKAVAGKAKVIWVREKSLRDAPSGMGVAFVDPQVDLLTAVETLSGSQGNLARPKTFIGLAPPPPASSPSFSPEHPIDADVDVLGDASLDTLLDRPADDAATAEVPSIDTIEVPALAEEHLPAPTITVDPSALRGSGSQGGSEASEQATAEISVSHILESEPIPSPLEKSKPAPPPLKPTMPSPAMPPPEGSRATADGGKGRRWIAIALWAVFVLGDIGLVVMSVSGGEPSVATDAGPMLDVGPVLLDAEPAAEDAPTIIEEDVQVIVIDSGADEPEDAGKDASKDGGKDAGKLKDAGKVKDSGVKPKPKPKPVPKK